MGVLVVDGSDVCRAPMLACVLGERLGGLVEVGSRGLDARAGATMCDSAATRLGFSGPAIAFYGAHRALPLSVADIVSAELVLTAERAQRSRVVRMLPGTQARVFTWREAVVLAGVLEERRRAGDLVVPEDLDALARGLHGVRGTVPLIEPPVRTGPFHWRRQAGADPLTVEDGHAAGGDHARATLQALEVAERLADLLAALLHDAAPAAPSEPVRRRRFGRSA